MPEFKVDRVYEQGGEGTDWYYAPDMPTMLRKLADELSRDPNLMDIYPMGPVGMVTIIKEEQ